MTVRYLQLDDYLAVAAEVTGQQVETVVNAAKTDLADSALHAPSASFAGQEFYPDFVDKAAVLVVRLAKNHPLPDGNKRAAWASMRLFIAYNDWTIDPYPPLSTPPRPLSWLSPRAPGTRRQPRAGSDPDFVPRRAEQVHQPSASTTFCSPPEDPRRQTRHAQRRLGARYS
ncbi:MAG TPA: Fic family protein [Acidimicrobiales bacterium]|nr:Fic family protein [Acidimicrobiales bacterium]